MGLPLQHNGLNFLTGPTWCPKKAMARVGNRRAAKNAIDGKTLYSVRWEHIASRDMQFVSGPAARRNGQPSMNVEQLIEKNYIANSRLSNATPEKFPRVIMNQFHRVSGNPNSMSYGMPRPPTRDKFKEVVDGIKREPTIVKIAQYPSLQEPVHCSTSDEFCQILGPSACNTCIENTNRHIGEQLQDMVFPTIDITTAKLIAPKISKLFRDGHRVQVRKKRLRELGFNDVPTEFRSLTRSETRLSGSTCSKCRKPIKVTKLNVTGSHGQAGNSRHEHLYTKKTMRFA